MKRVIHLTQTVRGQWAGRGGKKSALSLDELLRGSDEVPESQWDEYRTRPENGARLWAHPDEPDCGFLVKSDHIRDTVVGILNKKRRPVPEDRLDALERRVAELERFVAETEVIEE